MLLKVFTDIRTHWSHPCQPLGATESLFTAGRVAGRNSPLQRIPKCTCSSIATSDDRSEAFPHGESPARLLWVAAMALSRPSSLALLVFALMVTLCAAEARFYACTSSDTYKAYAIVGTGSSSRFVDKVKVRLSQVSYFFHSASELGG